MKQFLILLAMLPIAFTAYAQGNGTSLGTKAFKAAIDKDDALLLDVRTPKEFAQGHIEAAANADWLGGELLNDVSGIDKTKPVLLYCAVGGRSGKAMAAMIKAGFTDVHDLKGGFNAWEADKLPVITQ
ncbi:MAG: rhodanese-like domain-containing protein [Flavobacteriales bacterium]|jgi:rhodanese-related sulfurtransferase|nr:rhodanese-like domain-containing protein [Flavobacteriales bacterium]MBK6894186.1 rhodanese-like domain-containing protein [Flavobacteriales bacterium]MBK7248122.1 rhodanese-like domain-containing protein [Flavobacteriales bacterium]MBK7288465.1 rhodanese-like domain-containing protein [Flavobacteriales bacterium]MBK9059695.1 rhodanese-like domain-containing protein [Flavobacteriales bacterium]